MQIRLEGARVEPDLFEGPTRAKSSLEQVRDLGIGVEIERIADLDALILAQHVV